MVINFYQFLNEAKDHWKYIIKVSSGEEYDDLAEVLTSRGYTWGDDTLPIASCPVDKDKIKDMTFYIYTLDNKAMGKKFIFYGGEPEPRTEEWDELLTVKQFIEKYPSKRLFSDDDPFGEEIWEYTNEWFGYDIRKEVSKSDGVEHIKIDDFPMSILISKRKLKEELEKKFLGKRVQFFYHTGLENDLKLC